MSGGTIRIKDLPEATGTINTTAAQIAIDSTTTQRTSLQNAVNAASPIATQAEAEAGTDNAKRMTALRVRQATESMIGAQIQPFSNELTAIAALPDTNAGVQILMSETAEEVNDIIGNPPITANTMLVDNAAGTARETKTFAEVRTLLDLQGVIRTISFFGDIGTANDTDTVQSAQNYAINNDTMVDGENKVYNVTSIPDISWFVNAQFKIADIVYPTKDIKNIDVSRVTKSMFMCGWAQESGSVYKPFYDHDAEWLIVPFKYGYGDYFNISRYAFSIDFSGRGLDWSEPVIFLDYHPNPSVYGYNVFAAGIKHRRFVVAVEERNTSDRKLANLYMYDRLLDFRIKPGNAIALETGSPIATITVANHGLMPGDIVWTSGITGTGTNGLGGRQVVASVIDANTFTINKGSNSTVTTSATGGSNWDLSASFFENKWRITNMPTFPNVQGNNLTEVHSFADDETNPNGFWFGFHNGENSPRELGTIYVDDFYTNPTFTKDRIQSTFEDNAGEPSLRQYDDTLYLVTRGVNASVGGSSFNYKDSGGSWIGYKLPGNIHHGPVPFEIHNDIVYLFGSERSENEWEEGAPDNRWVPTRPRTLMLTVPLAEARVGNFSNFKQTVIHYGRFSGEANASGNGVGTTIKTSTGIFYFWSTQDWRHKGQYNFNGLPVLPSGVNPWKAWGIPEDIFSIRFSFSERPGLNDYVDRSSGGRLLGVSRYEQKVLLGAPVDINNGVKFSGRVDYKTHLPPVVVSSTGILTLPTSSSSDYVIDTFGNAATGNVIRIDPPAGEVFTNGTIITLQAATSARDHTYMHQASGGNLRNIGSSNLSVPNSQSTVCYKYYNGFFNMQYSAII